MFYILLQLRKFITYYIFWEILNATTRNFTFNIFIKDSFQVLIFVSDMLK